MYWIGVGTNQAKLKYLTQIKNVLDRVCQAKINGGLSSIRMKMIRFEFDSSLWFKSITQIFGLDLRFEFKTYWQNSMVLSNNE